jgi:hypothetical protein
MIDAMAHWVNQHSFVLTGLVLLIVATLVLWRFSVLVRVVGLVLVVAVSTAAAIVLRTGTGDVREHTDVVRIARHGEPVAIEFYSNL